jgi:helix-turn-helix protein
VTFVDLPKVTSLLSTLLPTEVARIRYRNRLLRGEDIDVISRELGVTAATVSGWRDHLLAGGQAALKTRQNDEHEEEVRRLKAKIGDQTMEIELLHEEARRLKQNLPLASRRSRT